MKYTPTLLFVALIALFIQGCYGLRYVESDNSCPWVDIKVDRLNYGTDSVDVVFRIINRHKYSLETDNFVHDYKIYYAKENPISSQLKYGGKYKIDKNGGTLVMMPINLKTIGNGNEIKIDIKQSFSGEDNVDYGINKCFYIPVIQPSDIKDDRIR